MCVCACPFQSSSPSHVSHSPSHQCTLQTSSVTFISCQKGSDLVTHPAPRAASATLFLPLCSSPGRAPCPHLVSAFEAGSSWSVPQYPITVHRSDTCTRWPVTTLLWSLYSLTWGSSHGLRFFFFPFYIYYCTQCELLTVDASLEVTH